MRLHRFIGQIAFDIPRQMKCRHVAILGMHGHGFFANRQEGRRQPFVLRFGIRRLAVNDFIFEIGQGVGFEGRRASEQHKERGPEGIHVGENTDLARAHMLFGRHIHWRSGAVLSVNLVSVSDKVSSLGTW